MIVVSKDKIPDLIRYGFRRHTQSKNIKEILQGKSLRELRF